MAQRIGIVVIGRNEGARLKACLAAIPFQACEVVYVDSGSTDGSQEFAARCGAAVVTLDQALPFTAARARNAGMTALLARAPATEFVQFLDGDCELNSGWLRQAVAFLGAHPAHAVVCGRVREREPQRSVFNRLCDLEWDTPVGEAKACGGNAMLRVAAFQAVGGFRETLIAGEEPELCVRLRRAGWRVHRLGAEMVLHDAAMTRFSQWWRRTTRSGYAFAEGAWLHGGSSERHWVREVLRALFYGGLFPLSVLLLALAVAPAWLLLLAVYPAQILRLSRGQGGFTRAFYLVLGRFPEFLGAMRFIGRTMAHGPVRLIEYK
ncbi:glycosyltransferase [Ramlibacter ginsenosidimutans]|uniref:Glycosyltransferase n=1 Tax=Ramlibacter ginsenosidimutans TaxID=502333 RepID=A0A934TQ05_9BURK|nr:glycosyltransferase [Ramlibacter ginsenosidimutans]MBK6005160.1 glycosyltransferase [Ramlibacter ginsenosidimutans]